MPRVEAERRFSIVPEWVVFHPDLSGNDVRVYAALARYAGSDGQAWPSYKTLAGNCGVSRSTVKRSIDQLEQVGAVVKKNRDGDDGAPTSNLYTVMTTEPGWVTSDPGGVTSDTTPRSTSDPGVGSPVTPEGEPLNENQSEGLSDSSDVPPVSHQDVFERVARVCGLDPTSLTRAEGGRVAKAAKGIRQVVSALDEIDVRAEAYRRKWPGIDLTPTALEANWQQVSTHAAGPRAGPSYCDVCGVRDDQHRNGECP